MATGDIQDILGRLRSYLPRRWFGDFSDAPIINGVLTGIASSLAIAYTLIQFAWAQTRLATSSGNWIDLWAADFFGAGLKRGINESDAAYVTRIRARMFVGGGTRASMVEALTRLTGTPPLIIEPSSPGDCGAYGSLAILPGVVQPGVTTYLTAGGMVAYAEPNQVRIVGGLPLIEGASTNYCYRFADYSAVGASGWYLQFATATFGASVTAPDGSTSGVMQLVGAASASSGRALSTQYQCALAGGAPGWYAFSVFAKSAGYPRVGLRLYDGSTYSHYGTVDVDAGTVVQQLSGTIAITPMANGWSRITCIGYSATGDFNGIRITLESCGPTALCGGTGPTDGVSGAYFWGPQLEPGQAATSLIPPDATPAARVADVAIPASQIPAPIGYGAAGHYGSLLLPYQAFVQVARPSGGGLPNVGGYGSSVGGYSTASRLEYASISMMNGAANDADLYAAINAAKAAGTVIWVAVKS